MIIVSTKNISSVFQFSLTCVIILGIPTYMCNYYGYTYIHVHALLHMYICYNCYVIQRRRLHKLVKRVSDPFYLYEQTKWLETKTRLSNSIFRYIWCFAFCIYCIIEL